MFSDVKTEIAATAARLVVEEGLEIEIVEVIVREEEVSSFVAEFG